MAPTDVEAIRFLTDIVRMYSPSMQERPIAEHVVQTMLALGYQADIDEAGNAVGRMGGGDCQVFLVGHIDTVPGEFPVRREGDLLYGRGSVDAKGPFAAFVMAVARVGVLPDVRLTVIGTVEEEAATSAGAYYVVDRYDPPEYVVVGEPSGWNRVTIAYKGRLLIDYLLECPMSHTASEGQRVCEEAVGFWQRVVHWAEAYNQDKVGRFSTLDPSLRRICSTSDGLCDRVEMSIGLRLPPGVDIDALIEEMLTWRGAAEVRTRGHEEPFRASKRNPLASAFLSAIRAEGGKPVFVTKTGTCDMNVLGPRWGCPIVAYGPGDSRLDHTPNEHIDLNEYLAAIRVLVGVLRRLAQVQGRLAQKTC